MHLGQISMDDKKKDSNGLPIVKKPKEDKKEDKRDGSDNPPITRMG